MSECQANRAAKKTFDELKKLKIKTPKEYIETLNRIMLDTRVTTSFLWGGVILDHITLNDGFSGVINLLKERALVDKKRLIIIGNGGSSAIAIHMLMDYVNAGDIRTIDFTSPALLTCMANDYGWENVFAMPIKKLADRGDVLFAISSSGQSKNILNACNAAKEKGCVLVTFSGMDENNPLRSKGCLNFYVPSTHYGFVELTHETLLHSILDLFIQENHA